MRRRPRLPWSSCFCCDAVSAAGFSTREEFLERISQLGGKATIDLASERVLGIDLSGTAGTDEDLAGLATVPELLELDVRLTGITDQAVPAIAKLENLRFLNLFRTRITDSGVETLEPLDSLEVGSHRSPRMEQESFRG